MADLEKQVYDIVASSNGIKAVEIAKRLGVDKEAVNHWLYKNTNIKFFRDKAYKWYAIPIAVAAAQKPARKPAPGQIALSIPDGNAQQKLEAEKAKLQKECAALTADKDTLTAENSKLKTDRTDLRIGIKRLEDQLGTIKKTLRRYPILLAIFVILFAASFVAIFPASQYSYDSGHTDGYYDGYDDGHSD
jgi:hypothetical protein